MARLATIDAWVQRHSRAPVMNLGCKDTPWGAIRVDVTPGSRPTVIADGRWLPFRAGSFGTVLLTNVLEELSAPSELAVLRETRRVLSPRGLLLLTATNKAVPRSRLDPEWWHFGYRYFRRAELLELLRESGFEASLTVTFGNPVAEMSHRVLLYALLPYRLVTGRYPIIPGASRPDPLLEDESGFSHLLVGVRHD